MNNEETEDTEEERGIHREDGRTGPRLGAGVLTPGPSGRAAVRPYGGERGVGPAVGLKANGRSNRQGMPRYAAAIAVVRAVGPGVERHGDEWRAQGRYDVIGRHCDPRDDLERSTIRERRCAVRVRS
jgi:hypothetical protein